MNKRLYLYLWFIMNKCVQCISQEVILTNDDTRWISVGSNNLKMHLDFMHN